MLKRTMLSWAVALISTVAFADIRLPNVLASNMVLQQKSDVKLWGWAGPTERVIITTSWDNKSDTVVASRDANWNITVHTPAAGGPYTITFKGQNTIVLDNVMLGEVWVCSGQSNMEWSSHQQIQQIIDEIPNSANTNIRLF
ncbi:MAG TPA: sialate O-acetylesterase, partial [Chitinophaga sp.]